jgi:hypothetical protein
MLGLITPASANMQLLNPLAWICFFRQRYRGFAIRARIVIVTGKLQTE